MTEELSKSRGAWKIWRNPTKPGESPAYLGDVYPPEGKLHLTRQDLQELGVGPGHYTVLAPEGFSTFFERWQSLLIPEC
jgi:hypothetical protein